MRGAGGAGKRRGHADQLRPLLSKNPDRRKEMQKRAEGGRTVPQIFIGELHIGGCDELYQLEQAKKLDALLNAA